MTVKRSVEILDVEQTTAMRDTAVRFLGEPALPRYETVQHFGHAFHRDLWRLIRSNGRAWPVSSSASSGSPAPSWPCATTTRI
ncbi:hypothetical protein [Streptomyces sp. GQFP]|uniref:hypothetical protein n=1 Tax=Streptomyces sp. GQFP TaxID=2907545 RepID=UPI001F384F7F|nr:hypothetical protein [Streptomyces sp. GQFP]UIX33183.1 hypothetical protein LUX31_25985 [Streptomyces sp. GQFP]